MWNKARGPWWVRVALMAVSLAACGALAGCQNFFVCDKSSCTNSGSGSGSGSGGSNTTGDYAYVTNSTSGPNYISEYNIGSGTLSAISGSPFSLGFTPVAMKVSPNNSFLYVGSGAGGIYLYTISSSGVLSGSSSPQLNVSTGSMSSMDISPDGKFLFVMDGSGFLLSEYQLNTSTGALTGPAATFSTPGISCTVAGTPVSQTCTVAVSPGGNYVAVALNTVGTIVYPYSSASGITSAAYTASIPCCSNVASPSGDYSLAFDKNSYLYIARTAALSSYGTVGTNPPTYEGSVTYNSGVTPRSVTLSTGYNYIFTANEGASTISSFGLSGAAQLAAVVGSPFNGPTNVSALGVDNSGTYLTAAGYNSTTGLQLFKLSSGALGSAVASAGTGTNTTYPALVALTH